MRYKILIPLVSLVISLSPLLVHADTACNFPLFQYQSNINRESGFCDFRGSWVPGLITWETWWTPAPTYSSGAVVWYSPGLMEAQLVNKGIDPVSMPYLDGIAVQSCADVGKTIWLRRPDSDWEGPFVAVDCSAREHMFTHIYYVGEVAEIGFATAERWGMVQSQDGSINVEAYRLDNVEMYIGEAPAVDGPPVDYVRWWRDMARFEYRGEWLTLDQAWERNPSPLG